MSSEQLRKDLKKPDEFVSLFEKLYQSAQAHQRKILYYIVAVLGVIFIAFAYQYWNGKKELKAADAFSDLVKKAPLENPFDIWEQDNSEPSALDQEEFLALSQKFLQEHASSSMVPIVELYRAKIFMLQKDYAKAADLFQKASTGLDHPYDILARENFAVANMALEKWEVAKKEFEALLKEKNNPTADMQQWNLGLIYEEMGDMEKAKQAYQEFETKFSESSYADQAKVRLFALPSLTS